MENGWYFSFMLVFLWQPSPHFQHPFMSCIMILNQLKKENKLLNSTKLYQQLFPYWTFEFNEYPKMNTFTKMFIFFYKGLGFLLSLYKVACILQSCHAVFILFFYQFFFFFRWNPMCHLASEWQAWVNISITTTYGILTVPLLFLHSCYFFGKWFCTIKHKIWAMAAN